MILCLFLQKLNGNLRGHCLWPQTKAELEEPICPTFCRTWSFDVVWRFKQPSSFSSKYLNSENFFEVVKFAEWKIWLDLKSSEIRERLPSHDKSIAKVFKCVDRFNTKSILWEDKIIGFKPDHL